MADRVLDDNFLELGSVVQFNEEGVADGSLLGIVVVDAKVLVLNTVGLGAQLVDARVGCGGVLARYA